MLRAHREELAAQLSELAEPVRAPGVQMQFGKRAGDHTADAVLQMTRTVTAGQLRQVAHDIDRALEKLEEGSYGLLRRLPPADIARTSRGDLVGDALCELPGRKQRDVEPRAASKRTGRWLGRSIPCGRSARCQSELPPPVSTHAASARPARPWP